MKKLDKKIQRVTRANRYEKGKLRHVILTLEPPSEVGARLEGTRDTYRMTAHGIYENAVKNHLNAVERYAKKLQKEGMTARSAKAKATKELKEKLK